MHALARRLSGAADYEVQALMAQGTLLAVLRACDLPQLLNLPSWELAAQWHGLVQRASWPPDSPESAGL